jgi:Holliday junction resolvase RusA-like endonuclease
MEALKFTILLPPTGQKRARSRTVRAGDRAYSMTYKEKGQRQEEEKLIALLYAYRPPKPLLGPLMLSVKAFISVPKSKSKKWQTAARVGEIRPTTKPDLDNLLKNIMDCLKGGFWEDDKQVVEYLPGTGKYYGDPARWEIEIHPWIPRPCGYFINTEALGYHAGNRTLYPELF